MTGHRTFTDAVRARAAEAPDRAALVLLSEEGDAAEAVAYRELDHSARELAGWLQRQGATGERVLIVQQSRRLFAISFLACLYAGAVAVPAPPTGGRGRHHEERIAGILKDAAVRIALTELAAAPEMSQLLARTGHGQVACLPVDAVPPAPGRGGWIPPDIDGDTPAFLQYTSGSTREPRGAVITHRNILANQRAIARALDIPDGARLGGWLPFHHDMGLVGQLLLPLWLGGTSVLLSPEAFVRKPVRWLRAIARHRLTVSGAPDFAYDLCARRVTDEQLAGLDLTGWRVAVTGGEPVRAETLHAFARRFAPAGLRPEALTPCYGLAESTLMVSGGLPAGPLEQRTVDAAALEHDALRTPRRGEQTRSVVGCGPVADGEMRIVDPESGRTLPEGRVGEIWLRGESVSRGYWGRPGENAEIFRGLAEDGGTGWLRTGDLGALVEEQLYVTGRLKELIVVAGRKLYPQDLERTVQRVSELFGSGTAFAVTGERERVIVVQELRSRSRYDIDLAGLTASVEAALSEEFEVRAGGVLLVRPGTVRRTTSGKVERAAMRELFLGGELKSLHQRLEPEVQQLLAGSR